MTFREAIDTCVKERKITKAALARKLGTIPQIFNDWTKKSKNMSVERMMTIMDALGYDIVVKDRISGAEITLSVEEAEK